MKESTIDRPTTTHEALGVAPNAVVALLGAFSRVARGAGSLVGPDGNMKFIVDTDHTLEPLGLMIGPVEYTINYKEGSFSSLSLFDRSNNGFSVCLNGSSMGAITAGGVELGATEVENLARCIGGKFNLDELVRFGNRNKTIPVPERTPDPIRRFGGFLLEKTTDKDKKIKNTLSLILMLYWHLLVPGAKEDVTFLGMPSPAFIELMDDIRNRGGHHFAEVYPAPRYGESVTFELTDDPRSKIEEIPSLSMLNGLYQRPKDSTAYDDLSRYIPELSSNARTLMVEEEGIWRVNMVFDPGSNSKIIQFNLPKGTRVSFSRLSGGGQATAEQRGNIVTIYGEQGEPLDIIICAIS